MTAASQRPWPIVVLLAASCGENTADSDDPTVPDGAPVVDLLFVIDNSSSMAEEQALVMDGFPVLVDWLLRPDDANRDGTLDYPAARDLHVGVISPDMGSGGHDVPGCEDSADGDDGMLLRPSACALSDDPWLTWPTPERRGLGPFAQDFSCVADRGTDGCTFAQPGRAIREALTVQSAGPNLGFLRDDSVLAIVVVTNGDDCSVLDSPDANEIFDPDAPLGPLGVRCARQNDRLESVSTLVQDLTELRVDHPERLVVAIFGGTPPSSDCSVFHPDCFLGLPEMEPVVDHSAEGRGERLVPSCTSVRGPATPPRRLVEMATTVRESGAQSMVESICADTLGPGLRLLARAIAMRL